ncbi:MAG: hypothetical protein KBF45_11030 [Cyclobacteriaceae bacterium]|jgi:hypothetical protein|nr:hypothetical protein [Cyclobacteriaceae bacterium]
MVLKFIQKRLGPTYFITRLMLIYLFSCCGSGYHFAASLPIDSTILYKAHKEITVKEILNKMYEACDAVTAFSSDLIKEERFDTKRKLRTTKLAIKASTQPDFKVAITILDSDALGETGSELVFPAKKDTACLKGWRSALEGKYHNIFQDEVIRAKDKEHHTFSHIGFQYLVSIMRYYQNRDSSKYYKAIVVDEKESYYDVTINDIAYHENSTYQVRRTGETIVAIADALHINQFKVWELNKDKHIDYLTPLKISQRLRVPTSYARKTILYIDKDTFLPLTQIIYDNNTVIPYEKYTFEEFRLNPAGFSKETYSIK